MSISLGSMDVGVAFVGDASGLQSATTQATAGVEKFGATSAKAMRQVAEDTAQANAAMERLATGIKGAVVGGGLAVGLVNLKNSITEMSAAIIDAQVQLDKWNTGFKFGAGSMAAGAREMAFVREEAQRLGLELSGSATQYMKLVAASRGTTMEGEKTRSVFTAIAEAATVMGMSSEQSERAFMAITQMMSKGKVQAEELRGQLGEHLPGAFAIAARAMGVTEVELNKLLETGNVMSADFLPKFGAQLRKELAGSVEDATKSMQASLNRYETAWLTFKQNVAQSGVSDFIGGQINILSDALAGVSERMEGARAAGGGFWAQTAAGFMGVQEFMLPMNAFSYSAMSLQGRLEEAQESLVTLQERAKTSPDSPFFRVEIAQTQLLIKELQRAMQAKAMLDVAPGPTGSVASGDSALARANQADYEKRLAAYKGLMVSMASPQEKFNTELAKQKALLGDLFTPEVEARLRAHYIKPVGQAREKTDEFAKALESLQEKATGLNTNYSETLATLYQGLNAGRFGQGEEGIANYRAAVESLIKLQPFFKDGLRKEAEALKASQDAMAAKNKAMAEYYDGLQKELGALGAKVEALQLEGQEIGLTDEYLLALTLRRLDDAIATEQQAMALASLHEASGEELVMMQRRIDLLKEQRSLTANNGQQKLAAEAAKDAAEEWKRASQQIEQSLTDALMRGFEGGKGFAENLRDTVVNMFKTMVLRPVVQATVQGGLNAVGLGSPGGQGGGNLLGTVGNLYSAFGSGSGAAAGTLAASNLVGAAGGDALGALVAGNASNWGVSAAGVTGSASAVGSIAAAAPYLAAVMAVVSLAKSLDDSGTLHTGGLGSYSAAGGAAVGDAVKGQGLSFNLSNESYQASTQQASVQLAQSIVGLLDSTATTFGKEAGYWAATGFADDTSKDGAWGALAIKMGDTLLADWKNGADKWPGREFADGEAGAREYAAAVALDVRNLLLEQTPEWADTMLRALGDAPSLEQLAATVGQINAAASALDAMGQASQAFATLGETAAGALITALGGAEAAVANLGGYYGNFYTETERAALATATLTGQLAELGVAIPASREAFRELVDAALSAGNPTLAAGLVGLSDDFAALVPATETAATAVGNATNAFSGAADAIDRAMQSAQESLAATRFDLENQLLTQAGQGSAVQDRTDARDLAALTAGLPADLAAQVAAEFAQNTALRDLYAASESAIASYRQGLEGVAADLQAADAANQAAAQSGIDAARNMATAAQAGRDALQSVFDLLGDSIASLRGTVASTAAMQAAEANAYIAQASVLVRSGATPDQGKLQAAIRAATSGIDQRVYASSAEQDYERLVLAGKLAELQDGTAGQLTIAEQHLSMAQQAVGIAEAQLAALNSIAANLGSAGGAQNAAAKLAKDQWSSVAGQGVYASSGGAVGVMSGSDTTIYGKDGSKFLGSEAIAYVNSQIAADSAHSVYAAAVQTGISAIALDQLMGWSAGTSNEWAKANNLPQFDVGTNFVPHDMVAKVHRGEMIVPAAYNPATSGIGGGSTERLERLVEDLTAEVQRLQNLVNTGNGHAQRSANTLERVAPGDAIVTTAAPAIA